MLYAETLDAVDMPGYMEGGICSWALSYWITGRVRNRFAPSGRLGSKKSQQTEAHRITTIFPTNFPVIPGEFRIQQL